MKTHVLHVDKVAQYYFGVTWFYVTSDVMSDKVIYRLRNFFLANITSTRVKLASKFDGTEIIVRFGSKKSPCNWFQYKDHIIWPILYGSRHGPTSFLESKIVKIAHAIIIQWYQSELKTLQKISQQEFDLEKKIIWMNLQQIVTLRPLERCL